MSNERIAADQTIWRSYYLTAMVIAVTLAGGCSSADNQVETLRSEIDELRESSKAATEKARLAQQRAACRGTVSTALMALHWEVFAETASETKMVREMIGSLRSEHVEWAFISANSQTDDPPLDEFETELLKRFARSPSPEGKKNGHPLFTERRSPVDGEYEYYQPIFYRNNCFVCHSVAGQSLVSLASSGLSDPEPYHEGDLIAIVKIRLKEFDTAQK